MSDFREVSEAELALVQSCGPDERVMLFGDEFVRLPIKTIETILGAAFEAAYHEAMSRVGGQTVTNTDMQEMGLGDTTITVLLTIESGEVISATAPIPDPRMRH